MRFSIDRHRALHQTILQDENGGEGHESHREIALRRGDPQVGAPGVKYHSEILWRCAHADHPKVLGVEVVIKRNCVAVGTAAEDLQTAVLLPRQLCSFMAKSVLVQGDP
jgi:hypothetical protein